MWIFSSFIAANTDDIILSIFTSIVSFFYQLLYFIKKIRCFISIPDASSLLCTTRNVRTVLASGLVEVENFLFVFPRLFLVFFGLFCYSYLFLFNSRLPCGVGKLFLFLLLLNVSVTCASLWGSTGTCCLVESLWLLLNSIESNYFQKKKKKIGDIDK